MEICISFHSQSVFISAERLVPCNYYVGSWVYPDVVLALLK